MKKPKVEVPSMRRTASTGSLRAFVSIKIGPLTIHDFRIVQQAGQRAYVQSPQREYERDGRRQFAPLLEYPAEWKEAISEAILHAWAVAHE